MAKTSRKAYRRAGGCSANRGKPHVYNDGESRCAKCGAESAPQRQIVLTVTKITVETFDVADVEKPTTASD